MWDRRRDGHGDDGAGDGGGGGATPGKRTLTGAIRRKAHAGASGGEAAADKAAEAQGNGAPLPGELKGKFEGSLGSDLSGVRVHTGPDSSRAADAMGARAYTVGQDIHFAAGQYQPTSPGGQELLAHEVAHTAQQSGSTARAKLTIGESGEPAEHEADTAARAMLTGAPARVTPDGAGAIRRNGPTTGQTPPPPPASTEPTTTLRNDMFSVSGAAPARSGHVTAARREDEVILTAPRISFNASVSLVGDTQIPPGAQIEVGPIQTILSSDRVGVYRRGGPQGEIVGEHHSGVAGAMRDAQFQDPVHPRPAVREPWYEEPGTMSNSLRDASSHFMDQPAVALPAQVGEGILTESRGADRFSTSLAAKMGPSLVHLNTFQWESPWQMTIAAGAGTGGELGVTPGGAAPGVTTGPIPMEQAGREWVRFPSVEAAAAAPTRVLLDSLVVARGADPDAYRMIVEGLRRKNPTFNVQVKVRKTADAFSADDIFVNVTGHRSARRGEFSLNDGQSTSFTVRFNEILDPDQLNAGSRIRFSMKDEGTISHDAADASLPYPFNPNDDWVPMAGGGGGQYSIKCSLS